MKNEDAVESAGLAALCTKRIASPSSISHNKFIVLVEGGDPPTVLTGGTNFSESGIFGHSNSVHFGPTLKKSDDRCPECIRFVRRSTEESKC